MTTSFRAYGGSADGEWLPAKGIKQLYSTGYGKPAVYYREHYWRMREDGTMDRRWVWVADGVDAPDPAVVFADNTTE